MQQKFRLDPRLANDCLEISELCLCKVLLMNNALFPWLILVPKKNNIKEIIDLTPGERTLFMDEISIISEVITTAFNPEKINIAALGNIVPQLHLHIIARYSNDAAWPEPVFGKSKEPYQAAASSQIITRLQGIIVKKQSTKSS